MTRPRTRVIVWSVLMEFTDGHGIEALVEAERREEAITYMVRGIQEHPDGRLLTVKGIHARRRKDLEEASMAITIDALTQAREGTPHG